MIPSYDYASQFCCCTVKKRSILKVRNIEGDELLDQGYTETCFVNLVYAAVGRQASARVSPEKKILTEFAAFSKWAIDAILDDMESAGFKI